MHAFDDPLMYSNGFDPEVIAKNPHTVLGTHKVGGHIGYHESLWGLGGQGCNAVIFKFLEAYRR